MFKMPYQILRVTQEWVTNDNEDFCVEDTEQNSRMWISNNLIGFTNDNRPYFRQQNDSSNGENILERMNVVDTTHEFQETADDVDLPGSEDNNLEDESTQQQQNKKHLVSTADSCINRKTFWAIIAEQLCGQNIEVSELASKKKWLNLVRTYKTTKDTKRRTGKGPVKFAFFDRLDDILGHSSANAGSHPLMSMSGHKRLHKQSQALQLVIPLMYEKRKNPSMELAKTKKKFLEEKMERSKENETTRKLYIEESLQYKKMQVEFAKEKLEVEKQKLDVLRQLLITFEE